MPNTFGIESERNDLMMGALAFLSRVEESSSARVDSGAATTEDTQNDRG